MTNFSDLSNQLADAVENASKSIVTVQVQRPISGTVIGDDLILTVAHVLHSDELTVTTPDGRELTATVAGRDPSSDLALLRAEGLNLPALSASAGTRVGELLLAVGRPQRGVQATLGLLEHAGNKRGWMNSGAAPFPGVSGGALLDARGGLVGLLNAGARRGSLLAVSAERALKVAGLLGQTGRVPRGYLGIGTQPVHFPEPQPETPDTEAETTTEQGHDRHDDRQMWGKPGAEWGWGERGPRGPKQRGRERGEGRGRGGHERGHERGRGFGPAGFGRGGFDPRQFDPRFDPRGRGGFGPHRTGRLGLTIVQVEPDSPAAAAGLKVGDVLLALDGEGVRHPAELLERVRERAGETLLARILRGGEEQDLSVTIGER